MLAYVLKLAFEFQRAHGYWPNMLYLNTDHYTRWQAEFSEQKAFDEITRRLAMEVIISTDALHPHVAWRPGHNLIAG